MVASPHGGQKERLRSEKMMKRGQEAPISFLDWGKSEEMGSGWDVERGNDEQQSPCGEVRKEREKAKSHLGQHVRKAEMSGVKRSMLKGNAENGRNMSDGEVLGLTEETLWRSGERNFCRFF